MLAAEGNQNLVEFWVRAIPIETTLNVTLTGANHLGMTFDSAGDLFITYTSNSIVTAGELRRSRASQLASLYSVRDGNSHFDLFSGERGDSNARSGCSV